jgi:peptidyl-prolyl cis-trans isomerase C
MSARTRLGLAGALVGIACAVALAQQNTSPATTKLRQPAPNEVAATVNGQAIPELAIFRVIRGETDGRKEEPKKEELDKARKEVLNFLIDNAILDQYLLQQKIAVDKQDVEKRLQQMKEEAVKEKQNWNELLKKLYLTEDDMRVQLTCALRWDAYTAQQATDKALRDLFDKNRAIFDGSQMQARHILITGKPEQAKAKIAALKKQIETQVAQELAKLPPQTTNIERGKERMKSMLKAFAEAAIKDSDCPSKTQGGELGWFPRIGAMVEPFARAAFALKPFEMSDAVGSEFGHHLILAEDFKPGKDVKFEDSRPVVKEVYCDRLREALLNSLKPRAQIVIQAQKQ